MDRPTALSRWVYRAGGILIVLLLLFAGVRIALKSNWLRAVLVDALETTTAQQLGGKLTIGSHSGDLLHGLTLHDATYVHADTLLSVKAVRVEYQLLPLMRKKIVVDKLVVDAPRVHIARSADGKFNTDTLLVDRDPSMPSSTPWEVAFSDIEITRGHVTFKDADSLGADELQLVKINAAGSYQADGADWRAHLRSLQFQVHHPLWSDSLKVSLAADADDSMVNLQELALRFGWSTLTGHAAFAMDPQEFNARMLLDPLAFEDFNRMVDPVMAKNVQVDIALKGSLTKVEVTARFSDGSAELLLLQGVVQTRGGKWGLSNISANSSGRGIADYFLVPESAKPRFQDAEIIFGGWLPLDDPTVSEGDIEARVSQLNYSNYTAGQIELKLSHRAPTTSIHIVGASGLNQVTAHGVIDGILTHSPTWRAQVQAVVRDLQQIDRTQTLPVSFNSKVSMDGSGLQLEALRGSFKAALGNVHIAGTVAEKVEMEGRLLDRLHIDSFEMMMGGGKLRAVGSTTLDSELPIYDVAVETEHFDLSAIKGFETLETDLNASIRITGMGATEENRNLTGTILADSSSINQTKLDLVDAEVVLTRNRLFIEKAYLQSEIADGRFQGDVMIDDPFRRSNSLTFQLTLKQMQPLASFAGAEILGAKGEIRGRIEQGVASPELVAVVALDDLAYDSVTVGRVVGQVVVPIQREPTYLADLELIAPALGDTRLDDIRINSKGFMGEEVLGGHFGVDINVQGESGLSVEGDFLSALGEISVSTRRFEVRGPFRTFTQSSGFNLTYTEGVVTTDTLVLQAAPDALLKVCIGHLSGDSTALSMDAIQVDLAALETVVAADHAIAGMLSGKLSVAMSHDRLELDAFANLNALSWDSLYIGGVTADASLANGVFKGRLHAEQGENELFQTEWEVPFQLGDPNDFDDRFFDLPVYATLTADSIDLIDYQHVFELFDVPAPSGVVSFSSTLGGTAGNPVLKGGLELTSGTLGGISVDAFNLGWNYDQSQQQLLFQAALTAAGQRLLSSSFRLPLNLDLRNFTTILPQPTDPIVGSLQADSLNMALIGGFLPTDDLDQIKGTLHGRLEMSGTIRQPSLDGEFWLRDASARVLPANIVLNSVKAKARFIKDRLLVESVTMRSGAGELNLSGYVALDGFVPDVLYAEIKARQFLFYDTRDSRIVASIDGKLSGSLNRPQLTGSAIVNSATLHLGQFGERVVESVQLDGLDVPIPSSMYDSLSIRMRLQIDPNVWLRNRTSPELALELQGDMDLLKDHGSDLRAFGTLNTRQGHAMQYGKRFQVERGQLNFSGDAFNPALDVVTLYKLRVPEDMEIRYLIGGTVKSPTFDFSSNPEMELENIISYTLFGKPFGALFSWQQSFSGGGGGSAFARDAAIGVLVDRVETLATQSLGIDLLQIDSNRQGETVTTSVRAGKYITDKLFVAVMNELGGSDAGTRVVLEYYVRRNLHLMLTQGNDRRSGLDVLWKYEY